MAEPRIILCADDYAQAPGISAGIRALAAAGRLSATSAMSNAPDWPAEAAALRPVSGRLAVGLHLTLTHGAPLGAMPGLAPDGRLPPLGRVLRLALTGRLRRGALAAELAAEIARQFKAFEAGFGAPPDHVDGHQHVHVLPGILEAVLREIARRYGDRPILLRDPRDRAGAILARRSAGKAALVAGLAAGLGPRLRRAGLVRNRGFAGFSDFGKTPYALEFESFLRRPGGRPMVMCHPGEGRDPADPIAERRPQELAYLQAAPDLPSRLWRPPLRPAGAPIDWLAEGVDG